MSRDEATTDLAAKLLRLVSLDKPENGGPYGGHAARECMLAMSDAAAALAKLRAERDYLRAGLLDLVEDDTRPGPEMRDVAQAILSGEFRRAGK